VKVALLTSDRERCGIARYSRDLYAELSRLIEVTLVPIHPWPPEGERLSRLQAADVVHLQHEYSFWGTAFPPPRAYYEGLELFRKPGRLVLTAHTVAAAETVVAARGAGLKPLVKRAALRLRPGLQRGIEAGPFLPGERVIVHNAAAADWLSEHLGGAPAVLNWPMPVQAWGAPASKWGPLSVQHRLHGRRLITMFGFVTQEKGYGFAWLAMLKIRKKHPDALLLIAGEARDRRSEAFLSYLRRFERPLAAVPPAALVPTPQPVPVVGTLCPPVDEAAERELPYRITGYLEDADARAILEQTEIALLPYRSATGSYAAGSALATGCPLLTSDLPAFAEPLPALRFRSGDVGDLAEKLDYLLSDEPARVLLSTRSRRYAEENNWARSAERHVALYRELLEGAG
jgi:glycosyltransferase involved in cell wall biosynthesis